MADELTETIVYPKNPRVKKAYISILGAIQQKKTIRLSVFECGEAICDYMGWVLDYDPRRFDKSAGPKYKEAIRLLKGLEGNFIIPKALGIVEICVYNAQTKTRVTNFDSLFDICSRDLHASEFGGIDEELVFTDWNDEIKQVSEEEEELIKLSVAAETDTVKHSVPLITDSIKSEFTDSYRNNPEKEKFNYISNVCHEGNFSADIEG